MSISAQQVKELREKTGAGMMECKSALVEADGDMDGAVKILRERGQALAAKKAGRTTSEGLVMSYLHAGGKLGVLVEVNCETDFVARTEDFQQLVKELAMQIAASNPQFVDHDDVNPELLEQERQIYRKQGEASGKPENVIEKIVEGRIKKYYSEVCLYDQPFIKDDKITVRELVQNRIAKLGENLQVRRFSRFKIGE